MPDTAHRATWEAFRSHLEKTAEISCDVAPAFRQALLAFLSAMDYDDPALIRSRLNEACETLRDFTQDTIQRSLGAPELIKESWRKYSEASKACPLENCDEAAKQFESHLNQLLKSLTSLRDDTVKALVARGYEIENAASLAGTIEELEELKRGILGNWPWSDQSLPPVNRKMVVESRAAIKRNEGEPIADLIRRLGGSGAKNG